MKGIGWSRAVLKPRWPVGRVAKGGAYPSKGPWVIS